MTKEQALDKIRELETFIQNVDKVYTVSGYPINYDIGDHDMVDVKINHNWAYTLYKSTDRKHNRSKTSKDAMIYLVSSHGEWADEKGRKVSGYLFYKSKH